MAKEHNPDAIKQEIFYYCVSGFVEDLTPNVESIRGLKAALKDLSDIDFQQSGVSIVNTAISSRYRESVLPVLLMHGANPNAKNNNNDTPLFSDSIYNSNLDLTMLLLAYGADVNAPCNSYGRNIIEHLENDLKYSQEDKTSVNHQKLDLFKHARNIGYLLSQKFPDGETKGSVTKELTDFIKEIDEVSKGLIIRTYARIYSVVIKNHFFANPELLQELAKCNDNDARKVVFHKYFDESYITKELGQALFVPTMNCVDFYVKTCAAVEDKCFEKIMKLLKDSNDKELNNIHDILIAVIRDKALQYGDQEKEFLTRARKNLIDNGVVQCYPVIRFIDNRIAAIENQKIINNNNVSDIIKPESPKLELNITAPLIDNTEEPKPGLNNSFPEETNPAAASIDINATTNIFISPPPAAPPPAAPPPAAIIPAVPSTTHTNNATTHRERLVAADNENNNTSCWSAIAAKLRCGRGDSRVV